MAIRILDHGDALLVSEEITDYHPADGVFSYEFVYICKFISIPLNTL